MKTTSTFLSASKRRTGLVLGFGLVLSAAFAVPNTPAQAAPRSMMSGRISMAQAERIAKKYVGRGAYVVRNEGVHMGMYRIHIHKNGVARHVFVGTRTGRVVKTRIISRAADRREDGR